MSKAKRDKSEDVKYSRQERVYSVYSQDPPATARTAVSVIAPVIFALLAEMAPVIAAPSAEVARVTAAPLAESAPFS